MAKRIDKPPKLPIGATRAQTQDYLYQMFKQGHPAKLALENLKKARDICEAARAFDDPCKPPLKCSDSVRGRPDED